MRFHIDKSMAALGIQHVVVGIARNVDPQATLSDSFLKKQREMEDWVLRSTRYRAIPLSKATRTCCSAWGAV